MALLRGARPAGPPPEPPRTASPAPAAAAEEEPTGSRWDDESLRCLIAETPPLKQRVVLRHLAEHAGAQVSAADLRRSLEETGAVTTQYSGRALGAILRGLKKRCAWYERPLPFSAWWDHDHGENRYRMPPEYGPPVLAALADLHGHDVRPA